MILKKIYYVVKKKKRIQYYRQGKYEILNRIDTTDENCRYAA